MRVLIVGDEPALAEALPAQLQREGHRVYRCFSTGNLLDFTLSEGVHLVVLDTDAFGFYRALDLCHTLCRETATMLLVVGASVRVAERVRLLEAGADDYLAKPFDSDEILARVHALLRRHPLSLNGGGATTIQVTEGLRLDLIERRLLGDGKEVALTDREFRLLAYLVRQEGVVLSREALLAAVWGPGYEGSEREIDVYVRYLRQKIEPDPAQPRYIRTSWRQGYQYKRPAVGKLEAVKRPRQEPQDRGKLRIVGRF